MNYKRLASQDDTEHEPIIYAECPRCHQRRTLVKSRDTGQLAISPHMDPSDRGMCDGTHVIVTVKVTPA